VTLNLIELESIILRSVEIESTVFEIYGSNIIFI